MRVAHVLMASVLLAVGGGGTSSAQSVCGGEVVFQCATHSSDAREQITVCARNQSYVLTRHALETGDMVYDPPLVVDPNSTWFHWEEADRARLEIGFWSTDLAEPVTLHVEIPWDDVAETVADDGVPAGWLQTPHWRMHVEQTVCAPQTVYVEPETLWLPQMDRGPIARFLSQDLVTPTAATVGVGRILGDSDSPAYAEGVPVYASARPNAATPIWWMLQPGETIDVLAHAGDYFAVAIPTNGVKGCLIRPERLGRPYRGPCSTGWVEKSRLERIQ